MSETRTPDVYDEKYLVCCGCHVRNYAKNFAIVMMALGLASSLLTLNVLGAIIVSLVYGLIIYADRSEKPWGYLPFLIAAGSSIILTLIALIYLFAQFIGSPKIDIGMFIMILFICCIAILFSIFHWIVVYRARNYMIDEILPRQAMQGSKIPQEDV